MIVVEVRLISAVSSDRDESLCRLTIVNTGAGTPSRGNYDVQLFSRGNTPRVVRTAKVENWPRNAKPAWRLVQAAMLELG